jgi:hypothetical protein
MIYSYYSSSNTSITIPYSYSYSNYSPNSARESNKGRGKYIWKLFDKYIEAEEIIGRPGLEPIPKRFLLSETREV